MKKQIVTILCLAVLILFNACQKEKAELNVNLKKATPSTLPSAALPGNFTEKNMVVGVSLPAPVLNASPYDQESTPYVNFWISNQVCAASGEVLYLRYYTRIYRMDRYTNFPEITYILVQDWQVIQEGLANCYSDMSASQTLPYCDELITQGCVLAWIWDGSQWIGPVQSNITQSYTYPSFCV